MANQFNWALGQEGKGNVYDDGSISTWRTDEMRNPHHYEIGQQDEKIPRFHFYISPEGGLWDGGTTFNNQTNMTDDQVVKKVVEQHPAVWDGRNEIFEDYGDGEWEPEERVEMPGGGFGHAEDLMNMGTYMSRRKLASSGWADFHTEFKLPRPVRKQLRRWVDRLRWPENHKKHDAREYHIIVLDMDEYDEDFAKWARKEVQGKKLHFKSTGMEMFNDFIVVRLDCPEWEELAAKWTEEAEKRGLEPHTFPGGPKAHVSVGRVPDKKWPKGVPNPHIKFHTQMFNIKKNSNILNKQSTWHVSIPVSNEWHEDMVQRADQHPWFHGTSMENAQRILKEGLKPWDDPSIDQKWGNEFEYDWLEPRPGHTYLTDDPFNARQHSFPNQEYDDSEYEDMYGEPPPERKQAVLKIDPSYLKAEHINPDEDASGQFNRPEDAEYDTLGQWAEDTGYGDVHKDTEDAIDKSRTLAYRGAVPPEAISLHEEYDPKVGTWGRPGQQVQPTPKAWENAPTGPDWNKAVIATTNDPDDDLKLWFDSFTPQEEQAAPSPYHTNETQFAPYTKAPVVQTPHIDPPKQPYAPYNWAEEGWEESPMDRVATVQWATGDGVCDHCGNQEIGLDIEDDDPICHNCGEPIKVESWHHTANTHHCPQCDAMIDGQICNECGYNPLHADSDYDKAKNEWYDRAWSHPGDQPLETPKVPVKWRDDHAKDVSLASRKVTNGHQGNWNFGSRVRDATDDLSPLRGRELGSGVHDQGEGYAGILPAVRSELRGPASLGWDF